MASRSRVWARCWGVMMLGPALSAQATKLNQTRGIGSDFVELERMGAERSAHRAADRARRRETFCESQKALTRHNIQDQTLITAMLAQQRVGAAAVVLAAPLPQVSAEVFAAGNATPHAAIQVNRDNQETLKTIYEGIGAAIKQLPSTVAGCTGTPPVP